jgi:hypothetical protein
MEECKEKSERKNGKEIRERKSKSHVHYPKPRVAILSDKDTRAMRSAILFGMVCYYCTGPIYPRNNGSSVLSCITSNIT